MKYLSCCPECDSKNLLAEPSEDFPQTETFVECLDCGFAWFIDEPFDGLSTESGDNSQ